MRKSLGLITVSIVFVMLLGTTAFAADAKLLELNIDSYKGSLMATNYKGDLADIKQNGIKMTEYGGAPPAQFAVTNAVSVSGATTVKLNIADAAYCAVKVYKMANSGDGYYTYLFGAELPVKGTMVEKYEGLYKYAPGASIEISEAGLYLVDFTFATEYEINRDWTIVKVEQGTPATSAAATERVGASPTISKVVVNAKTVAFESYNINGSNYFILMDFAYAVNSTAKQFGVAYDAGKMAISLTSNSPYKAVGGELAIGDGKGKTGTANTAPIYKDGAAVQMQVYNISGNNYFKLRDLGKAFDIGITWDAGTNTVQINTANHYTE